jgi:hypothetical protein
MTEADKNIPPNLDDTRPIIRRRGRLPAFVRWLLVGFAALSFLAVIVALAVPSLGSPPADLVDPYEVFSLGDSSEILDPSTDHLVLSADDRVAIYIPQGAQLGPGQFLILERKADFIPGRVEPGRIRLHAVDLLIVRPDGELDGDVAFEDSLLLCFQLEPEEQLDQEQGGHQYSVQRYIEEDGTANWQTIDAAPGWQAGQVCSTLNHISLYALVQEGSATETPSITPTAEDTQPKGGTLEIYGLPTASPTP